MNKKVKKGGKKWMLSLPLNKFYNNCGGKKRGCSVEFDLPICEKVLS